jgi:hypothetical protein
MIQAGVETMMRTAVRLMKRKVQPTAPLLIEEGPSRFVDEGDANQDDSPRGC